MKRSRLVLGAIVLAGCQEPTVTQTPGVPSQAVAVETPTTTQRDHEWSVAQWTAAEPDDQARVIAFWTGYAADLLERRTGEVVLDEQIPAISLRVVACTSDLSSRHTPDLREATRVELLAEECAEIVADELTREEIQRLREAR